jgi:hypothetical protein
MIAQPWLYTAGSHIGNPKNQPVHVLFFGKQVNLFSRGWMIFGTTMSVVSLVFGIAFAMAGIVLLIEGAFHPDGHPKFQFVFDLIRNRFHSPRSQNVLRYAVPICMLVMLAICMVCVEGTLGINDLSLNSSIIKSDQFIALIVSICNMTMIPYTLIRRHNQPIQHNQNDQPGREEDLELGAVDGDKLVDADQPLDRDPPVDADQPVDGDQPVDRDKSLDGDQRVDTMQNSHCPTFGQHLNVVQEGK